MARLHDGMESGWVRSFGRRGFGFIRRRGGPDLYFSRADYRRPFAGEAIDGEEVEIQYRDGEEDNSLDLDLGPDDGEWVFFRLGRNAHGDCAIRWCFRDEWEQAAAVANGLIADRERARLVAEAARQQREMEEAEYERLNPTTIAEAERRGWRRNEAACHHRTVVMLLDLPDGKKKSKTFNLPKLAKRPNRQPRLALAS